MFGTDLPFPAESPDHLWFYYINNNRTFMLDGQGVTAEVVEPDIGNFGFFLLLKMFMNDVLSLDRLSTKEKYTKHKISAEVFCCHFNSK